ncbi:hypothetical protein T440DRAFT_400544 [Plenodomus tracheiphilus IPT5]|uniref:BHLH domain-containing protein n=1 Tax=Plenodomus tracheiphilus IPT5 TaxID=1408161 RepID=A0A6A7B060_9PLEO|nr:hypothetical protein T440DRAFT_400544 [Plenodomus tracheiphilus IPT5]
MEISGFPKIASLDYSPSEAMLSYSDDVDITYAMEAYNRTSDSTMNSYFNTDNMFDRPLTSAEMSSDYQTKQQDTFNPTLPATGISATNNDADQQQMFNSPTFGQFNQYPFGFAYDPSSLESNDSTYFSPQTHATSRTPSLCGDAPQEAYSPTLSPHKTKEESPGSPASLSEDATPKRPLRKRGRPRLEHSSTDSKSTTPSSKSQRSGRLPHNQVERKYREGLNSELERLRKAVPSLPQSDEGGVMGQPKPSKAMVLSSAIEYIRKIKNERDTLKEENERLRQGQGSGSGPSRQGSSAQNRSWREDRSLNEFLMDP